MKWIRKFGIVLPCVVLVAVAAAGGSPASAQDQPSITVTAPANGGTVEGADVTVEFNASGISLVESPVALENAGERPEANVPGEGHVHLMLDLLPVVVWPSNEPYTFTDVPPGPHELSVEIVNNDHSSLSPPVVQQIQFQTTGVQEAPPEMPVSGGGGMAGSTDSGQTVDLQALFLVLLAVPAVIAFHLIRRRLA